MGPPYFRRLQFPCQIALLMTAIALKEDHIHLPFIRTAPQVESSGLPTLSADFRSGRFCQRSFLSHFFAHRQVYSAFDDGRFGRLRGFSWKPEQNRGEENHSNCR
jgi:hypothetical protein